jgi:hypothetical protein
MSHISERAFQKTGNCLRCFAGQKTEAVRYCETPYQTVWNHIQEHNRANLQRHGIEDKF